MQTSNQSFAVAVLAKLKNKIVGIGGRMDQYEKKEATKWSEVVSKGMSKELESYLGT